jgi:hypothetical protein
MRCDDGAVARTAVVAGIKYGLVVSLRRYVSCGI